MPEDAEESNDKTHKPEADSLDKRIRDANEVMASFPLWVQQNCYFAGGHKQRDTTSIDDVMLD